MNLEHTSCWQLHMPADGLSADLIVSYHREPFISSSENSRPVRLQRAERPIALCRQHGVVQESKPVRAAADNPVVRAT